MLVISTGIHWVALQTVAWAGMIVSYSEKAPLKTALAETFDGKYPCPLCKAIAAGKKSEKKSEFTAQTQNWNFRPRKAKPGFDRAVGFPTFAAGKLLRRFPGSKTTDAAAARILRLIQSQLVACVVFGAGVNVFL